MPVPLVIQVKGLISLYEWFRLLVYYRKVHSDKLPLVPNVRRYVALAHRCIGTVARVFVLVVRCRVKRLVVDSRVGKNRDTRRESPARAGADRTADHLAVLFSQKVLTVRKANDIYRPVSKSYFIHSYIRQS